MYSTLKHPSASSAAVFSQSGVFFFDINRYFDITECVKMKIMVVNDSCNALELRSRMSLRPK